MSNYSEKRLLEFEACMRYGISYRLYVKEGKPIRIICETPCETITIYPENRIFNSECYRIIGILCEYKNLKNLKRLYNALGEGKWKEHVGKCIEERINYFEKGIANLKS